MASFQTAIEPRSERDLRVFGLLQFPFALLIAWGLNADRSTLIGLATISGLLALITMVRPHVIRPLYLCWMAIALPIGFFISHFLMAIVYYSLVTPIGLYRRWRHGDPLQRSFEPTAESYWQKTTRPQRAEDYFRQF